MAGESSSFRDSLPEGKPWDFKEHKYNAAEIVETVNGLTKTTNQTSETVNHLSKTVNDISMSLTTASLGAEGVKGTAGFLAGGATAAKVDFTGFKVDEKGVVLFGKQLHTWPWARDDKANFELAEKRASKQYKNVSEARSTAAKSIRAARLNPGDTKAMEKAQRDLSAYRRALREAKPLFKEANELAKKMDQSKKEAESVRRTISASIEASTKQTRTLQGFVDSLSRSVGH